MNHRLAHSSPLQAARILFVSLGACAHSDAAQLQPASAVVAAPVPAAPAVAPRTEPIGAFMADHSTITTYARDCVIVGDLEAMREPLQALADYRYPSVAPGAWIQGVAELQEAARLTAGATTLDTAAAGVATMGRICGDCHEAQGAGPRLEPINVRRDDPQPPDRLPERMYRHMWGAEQLWQGLTTPSAEAWNAGAWAIGEGPELAERNLPRDLTKGLAEIRTLGHKAGELETAEQRADLYGLLLTRCADCHLRALDHDL